MSEPTPETPAAEAAPAPKKPRGKLFMILGVVVVLLAGGGGAAFWWLRTPSAAAKSAAPKAKAPKKLDLAKAGIVNFEPFVVNLADAGAKRFLRINVRLLVDKAEEAEHIQKSEVLVMRLRSDILELLTAQTSEKIVSAEGKAELKKQIIEHTHQTVAPAEVADVLFSDFVVQY
jgi:flagellar FliL protein